MKWKIQWEKFAYTPVWNLFLITAGGLIYSFGIKAIVFQYKFIPGGIYGLALFIYHQTNWFSPAIWFFFLNVPLFLISWFYISKRFLFYSLYAMVFVTLTTQFIDVNLEIHNQLYAAIAAGMICGTGSGIILRSLGSGGGLDVIGVMLNRRFNIGIGKVIMSFNVLLFVFVVTQMGMDLLIASIILVFISASALDYVLSLFNQKKIVYVISDKNKDIAKIILEDLHCQATFIKAKGAFSGKNRDILMSITNNIQLKRLEEAVFTVDPSALFIVENTFNVIGSVFGKRKVY
ncbi:MAG: YitT family protein [Desulfobacterales bacterium]|nr:YitT family protein [Desulfobacterales bacterium]MDD4072130.1 YitT family protein [Desulfobacterales bacterium]MDD4391267.1 YitT family protein [Desulfobacterales bacterium]